MRTHYACMQITDPYILQQTNNDRAREYHFSTMTFAVYTAMWLHVLNELALADASDLYILLNFLEDFVQLKRSKVRVRVREERLAGQPIL